MCVKHAKLCAKRGQAVPVKPVFTKLITVTCSTVLAINTNAFPKVLKIVKIDAM